MNAIQTKLFF